MRRVSSSFLVAAAAHKALIHTTLQSLAVQALPQRVSQVLYSALHQSAAPLSVHTGRCRNGAAGQPIHLVEASMLLGSTV